jgi:hypothetical protein
MAEEKKESTSVVANPADTKEADKPKASTEKAKSSASAKSDKVRLKVDAEKTITVEASDYLPRPYVNLERVG